MEKEILEFLTRIEAGQNRIEAKVDKLEQRFDKLEAKVDKLEAKVDKLDERVTQVENRLDETYQIVKALEHSAEVNKAEHDSMSNDIAHIKGDVSSIRKDLTQVEMVTSSNWNEIAKLKAII